MEYSITYNQEQLKASAKFVFEHNFRCSSWPQPCYSASEVEEHIIRDMMVYAKENMSGEHSWLSTVSTGGYHLVFTQDVPDQINVEIYVDAAISSERVQYAEIFEIGDDED